MDEAVSLQVLHPFTHILAHAQQDISAEMALSLPEEIQKAAPFHELGNNVNGLLLGAHAVELYQLGVCQIMTLASSMKSSSHMAPSRIALMATLYWARHLPSLTTPKSPLPNSLIKVSSEGLISHLS